MVLMQVLSSVFQTRLAYTNGQIHTTSGTENGAGLLAPFLQLMKIVMKMTGTVLAFMYNHRLVFHLKGPTGKMM